MPHHWVKWFIIRYNNPHTFLIFVYLLWLLLVLFPGIHHFLLLSVPRKYTNHHWGTIKKCKCTTVSNHRRAAEIQAVALVYHEKKLLSGYIYLFLRSYPHPFWQISGSTSYLIMCLWLPSSNLKYVDID